MSWWKGTKQSHVYWLLVATLAATLMILISPRVRAIPHWFVLFLQGAIPVWWTVWVFRTYRPLMRR